VTLAALTLGLVIVAPSAAHAHPLGNFTVNRYSGLQVLPGQIRVEYVIDMAEIPAFQELPAIDADADGSASASELSAWASVQAQQLLAVLVLEVDGERLSLAPEDADALLLPGQGGLDTLRFEATFAAAAPDGGRLSYEDRSGEDRIGWREVTAVGADGRALSGSSVPAQSVSDELLAYPDDALSSPPDVRAMTATFAPSEGGSVAPSDDGEPTTARPGTEAVPFAGALTVEGLPLVALALLIAVGLGAWHALLPGHGKTIMAAAMVGSGARARQAIAVAGAVALMHSASVMVLGLAVLALERTFRPETIYPWLGGMAGLAAVGVGAYLLRVRWAVWRHHRAHRAVRDDRGREAPAIDHDHGTHEHEHAHAHTHEVALDPTGRLGVKGLVALALAGGILPAPSALLVMLGAVQAHRVVYGIALVAAFSAGLAAALLGVGVGALRARDAVARRLSATASLAVPLVSAAAILVVGAALTVRAVASV
ncbi:MAG: hypothetical protein ACXWWX_06710, partial [Actinomycetota bacterium]